MTSIFWKIADKKTQVTVHYEDGMYLWSGFADSDYAFYAESFYDAANFIIQKKRHNLRPNDDKLVFPIMYSSQMFIELSLKHILYNICLISKWGTLSTSEKSGFTTFIKTHDLERILEIVTGVSEKIDPRLLAECRNVTPFISDFYSKFPNANEMLRYPWVDENTQQKFLEEKDMVFSLSHFGKALSDLNKLFNSFRHSVYKLQDEYDTNSYTKCLSRDAIHNIAKELPKFNEWTTESFVTTKSQILSKYDISGRNFSDALDIIKTHQEFSKHVGIDAKLEYLTKQDLNQLINLPVEPSPENKKLNMLELQAAFLKKMSEPDIFYDFLGNLSYNKLIELYALYQMAIHGNYIESLANISTSLKKSFPSQLDISDHFARKSFNLVKEKIEEQMKTLGWL